jgi:hypothetical protein
MLHRIKMFSVSYNASFIQRSGDVNALNSKFLMKCSLLIERNYVGAFNIYMAIHLLLQLLASTNRHCACMVSYGPFSLCVIHKEGLCPNSGGINRLMIMIGARVYHKFVTCSDLSNLCVEINLFHMGFARVKVVTKASSNCKHFSL